MKNILFVSFDFHEENKPIKSLAIATLESYLVSKIEVISIDTYSFNMNDEYSIRFKQMADLVEYFNKDYDYICISMYAWNMSYISSLLDLIKETQNHATLIVGGYEVNSRTITRLVLEFKEVNHFIIGYAEESLYKIISEEDKSKVLSYVVGNNVIPEIYNKGIIKVNASSVIRLETKRGCPGKCTFCAYKNNDHKELTIHNIEKVKRELYFLNKVGVKKVNVLDAIFSLFNYREVIDYLVEIEFMPILNLQMKFEILHKELIKYPQLMGNLKKLNVQLEFGLQTISQTVLEMVDRVNDLEMIQSMISTLNKNEIDYEVSLIRGLPGETKNSFSELLDFMRSSNCKSYVIFPLTLLTNTKLYDEREMLDIKVLKQNGLEYVVGTLSYTYKDYLEMITMEIQSIGAKEVN